MNDDISISTDNFIKNYNENGDIGYFLEVNIEYPKTLFDLHKDLPFLPERKKIRKVEKLICDIEDKEKYVIYINALKQALNHGLRSAHVRRVIRFNQEAWLKPYIDLNTNLERKLKMILKKTFLS